MRAKSGFTLVEILIVVIILGILAAIVVPQFTDASTQAKLSSLRSDLQTIRSQIQLYKAQHNSTLPAQGAVTFVNSMTQKTTVAGVVDANGAYGPYLQAIPTNPYNDLSTVRKDGAAAGANTSGWRFDSTTGASGGAFQSDYDATTAAY
jgi:general secretion pathway protein G